MDDIVNLFDALITKIKDNSFNDDGNNKDWKLFLINNLFSTVENLKTELSEKNAQLNKLLDIQEKLLDKLLKTVQKPLKSHIPTLPPSLLIMRHRYIMNLFQSPRPPKIKLILIHFMNQIFHHYLCPRLTMIM